MILSLLLHLSQISKDMKDVSSIISNIVEHKEKWPSANELELIATDLLELIEGGIIAIPGLEKNTLLSIIKSVVDSIKNLEG